MTTDRRAALQEVEELLEVGEVPESRRFAHQARLEDAAATVQRLLDLAPDADLHLAACRLADARRLRAEALQGWERLADAWPDHRDVARFHLAVAHSRNGELQAARGLFDGLRDSSQVDAALLAREKRRLDARADRSTSQDLVLRAMTALEDGKRSEGQDLLHAAVVVSGIPSRHRATADAVVRAICSLQTGGDVASPSPTERLRTLRPRAVAGRVRGWLRSRATPRDDASSGRMLPSAFVAGFGWSGSGAVFDYLAQFERIVTPVGRTEIPWIERPFGAKGVLPAIERDAGGARRAAVRFVLASVLGLGDPAVGEPWRPETVRSLGQVGARSAVRRLSAAHHVAAVREGTFRLLSAAALRGSDAKVSGAVRTQLFAALQGFLAVPRGVYPHGVLSVLNNPVHGFNARLIEHFPSALLVPVFRDPRDQYVARVLESGGRKTGVDRFIATVSKHYRRYERAVAQHQLQEQVLPVQFEEFVADAGTRRWVLEQLGLDPELDSEVTRYDPSDSVDNIGVHRQYEDREAIRTIEQKMSRYLVAAAD